LKQITGCQVHAIGGQAHSLNLLNGVAQAKRYFGTQDKWPQLLVDMRANQWEVGLAWSSFALMVYYL